MATKKATKKTSLAVLSTIPAESFKYAGATRDLCVQCGRGAATGMWEKFIPGKYTGGLLIVFDTPPSANEASLVRELAAEAGYEKQDVAWISAVRCGADKPSMDQIRCCRPFVLRALDYLKPKLVIAAGSSATRSLTNLGTKTNITELRGRPLTVAGREEVLAYATYAPSAVLLGGLQYRDRIIEDLSRAGAQVLEYPVDALPTGSCVAVDTEYAPNGDLLTLGIADDFIAAAAEVDEPDFATVLGVLEQADDGAMLQGHSLSGDVDRLVELGVCKEAWVSGEKTWDSLLLARMANENRGKGGYELESLLTSRHNVNPWKAATKAYDETDATTWPPDLRRERCRLDAWAACKVVTDHLYHVLGEGQPVTLTHMIAMSIHRIELAGVYIDRNKFLQTERELHTEAAQYKDRLTKKALSYGMTSFNPTNDGNIRDLLFKRMKLEVVKTTKKGNLPSVDKTTLKQHVGREEVDLLLKFNAADKALSTNIVGVAPLIVPVGQDLGYLPVHINPLGARTGRRSSEKPNMQNWPPKMRQMVVSRYPNGSVLEFDYKSLEVFLLAFEAGDQKLYDYFANQGGYIAVARDMWGKEVVKGSTEYRATKSIVLGTNYNMQTALMAENLWFLGVRFSEDYEAHTEKVDTLREAYLDMFPGIRRFMYRQRKYLIQHQCARTRTGSVRHLPHTGPKMRGFGRLVNQAINYPIQGLAAHVTGTALLDCEALLCRTAGMTLLEYHELLLRREWDKRPIPLIINEVHDSLLFDLPYGPEDFTALEIAASLKATMEQARTLRLLVPEFTMPLVAEMKIGRTWGAE